ncbi:glycoside hydrolase family 65 protein [Undibacterium sp.]|uniref:glycoside hydrolase family 65 protein n=1 Tax=Undibacterium sp. TaxID=1914977 RepID=UPI002BCEF868|nr:glycosyl hydrolase family 65 protein [Undibacterium sp.]HTD06908.1 glycosyl hydrolase family 65 protein [Undibacterium sp.]
MPIQDVLHHTYPLEPWRITENKFDTHAHFLSETLFALGNGYIGLRGTQEEGYRGPAGTSLDGTYLNGFFEAEAIHHPETAFGLARTNQFMLNVPNAKCIECWLGHEQLDLLQGTLTHYERSLDFRTGVLSRSLKWTSPSGRQLLLHSRRLVCFDNKHLFAIRYEITPLNFSGDVRLISAVDGAVKNIEAGDDPRVGSAISGPALELIDVRQDGAYSALVHRTANSGLTLASAMQNQLDGAAATTSHAQIGQRVEQTFHITAAEGEPIRLSKFACYFSSRDYPEAELLTRSKEALTQAQTNGFDALCQAQENYLRDFWQQADVEIAGDDALQQGMHFNQFHLLQSVGRDGKTNIAAKGVTGEGYEGHYFWDTEIYVLPFFLFNKPEIARKLLEYRYTYLPQARERARQMSHAKGALYPWRTIAGEECSAYFPAGTAQYHINADIAYAIKMYVEASGDDAFLLEQGAEIVLETARIWMDLGSHTSQPTGGRTRHFCINEVTGPDEYTALVNNNYYTNAMAQMHLRFAADIANRLQSDHPVKFSQLAAAISLGPNEVAQWREAADLMYLPYDENLGIHQQDDSFLSKKIWDFAGTPKNKYPLLLHYHPMVIYRHQVCKQADVVLALLLLSEQFSLEDKKRDFDYYETVTTHDSSLSTCIFSIIASEVGYHDKAYDYFMETARLDLDNTHGNTHYGVHTAAMAGTWLGVAYGFGGMRLHNGQLKFSPVIPERWTHYRFKVHIKECLLQVSVNTDAVEYTLLRGDGLGFLHAQTEVTLTSAAPARSIAVARPIKGDLS